MPILFSSLWRGRKSEEWLFNKIITSAKELGKTRTSAAIDKKPKTGGKMMIDKYGNKAMVYPDKSYEEVK